MKVDDQRLSRLDTVTTAPGWLPAEARPSPSSTSSEIPVPNPVDLVAISSKSSPLSAEVVSIYCQAAVKVSEALIKAADHLNSLDRIGGDGDCGVTLERGAKSVMALMMSAGSKTWSASGFVNELASAISTSMGGSSGALLEICFRAMSRSLNAAGGEPSALEWAGAVHAGVEAMEFYGGAKPGYRTMLDAWIPAAQTLSASNKSISDAATAARKGAEATKDMGGMAGRSNYVSNDILRNHVDPGAEAVAIAFEALSSFLVKK